MNKKNIDCEMVALPLELLSFAQTAWNSPPICNVIGCWEAGDNYICWWVACSGQGQDRDIHRTYYIASSTAKYYIML